MRSKSICFCLTVLMMAVGTLYSAEEKIEIKNGESLIHIGSLDSFELTPNGIEAGRLLWEALKTNDVKIAQQAIDLYKKIIPLENFGGEYSSLQWLCEHRFFPKEFPLSAVENPLHVEFYHFFLDNDAKVLKEYLVRKYKLQKIQDKSISEGLDRRIFLEDYILFNNPRRADWENTPKFIESINARPGEIIGDVGCGPGLFSYLLSKKVGPTGKIYALDLNKDHLEKFNAFLKKYSVTNVSTHVSSVTSTKLPPNTLDAAILTSLYHIIYAEAEEERNAFVLDLKSAIKPGGRLIVIDNSPVTGDTLPYHSNYIAAELIIGQLKFYGFELVKRDHIIAQRYLLEFRNKK